MRRALVMAMTAAVTAAVPLLLPVPASAQESSDPSVIVVGVPGLRWSDVDPRVTPALARLAGEGAVGVVSIRTAGPRDCPGDGWLSLGAGNRVVAAGQHPARCPAQVPAPASLPQQVRANADRREGADPGALADALRRHGRCAAGLGAGARLAAADSTGDDGVVGADPPIDPASLLAQHPSLPTAAQACSVLLLEAPAVGTHTALSRASGLSGADALVRVIDQVRPAGSTLLVVGVSEAPGDRSSHLHLAMAVGPRFRSGALRSASTRRAPYVQVVDVAPTVLSLLGIAPPTSMIGQPWRSTGARPSIADLQDEERKADGQRQVTVPFFVILVGVQLLVAGVALRRRRWGVVEVVALAGTTAVGASYLANLYPWWRLGSPLAAMLTATSIATALMTAVSLFGRGLLGRVGIACGLTAGVIVVDLLTGAHLQMSSVAGYSPIVAGRFAGLGNVAFGVLAAAALLAAAATRSATIAALSALVVVVDGAPMWGSDVGGVLALVPAYVLLVLLLAGRTVNVARLALAGLVGALVVTAFGIADHARPADQQTHLGRFVGQVIDGTAGGVIRRKTEANLALLFHSAVTALLPLVVLFLVVLFLRPPGVLRRTFEISPAWRAGLLAVLTAGGVGFVVNDSGAAVLALAIVVTLPATLAVLARHARGSAGAG